MSDPVAFDCDHFLSLTGDDLVRYAEPFVNTRQGAIPGAAYDPIRDRLELMDDEHIVYAMEICWILRPGEFLALLVDFLSHEDSSVCCSAFRLLKNTPPDLVSARIREMIAATPSVDLYTHDVRTGTRIRIGTNDLFLRDLAPDAPRKIGAVG